MEYKVKSALYQDYLKTFETNLHNVNPVFDLHALEEAGNVTIRHLNHSGLLAAASFLVSTQSLEFVIACVKHYNPATREIKAVDGRVLCSFKPKDIERCFSIPPWPQNLIISIEECEKTWLAHKDKYRKKVAQRWLRENHNTLPKNVGRGEFKEEISIIITLLSRITGQADANKFQPWMFYIISHIMNKSEFYSWPTLISDCLHQQMTDYLKSSRVSHDLLSRLLGSLPRKIQRTEY